MCVGGGALDRRLVLDIRVPKVYMYSFTFLLLMSDTRAPETKVEKGKTSKKDLMSKSDMPTYIERLDEDT